MINSPDFWSILSTLRTVNDAAGDVFSIVEEVTASSSAAITADNFESAVGLLNDFASAGSVGAASEQKREAMAKRNRGAKATTPSKRPYASFPFLSSE